MYHYSARQTLIDAKQQQLLTAAARARTLRELRKPGRSWRRKAAAEAVVAVVAAPACSPVPRPAQQAV
jgi:hypothetical protein